MARQRLSRGLPTLVYSNETGTRQELSRAIYLDETGTLNASIVGAAGTGSAGSLIADIQPSTTGIAHTGNVGLLSTRTDASASIVGAAGTGSVGSPVADGQPSTTGIASTGSAGSLIADIQPSATGIAHTGGVGLLSTRTDASASMVGVFATSEIGALDTNRSGEIASPGVIPIYQRILAYHQDEQLQDGWDTTLRHRRGRTNWIASNLSVSKAIDYAVTGTNPTDISVSKTIAYATTDTAPTAISVSKTVTYAVVDLVIATGVSATGAAQPLAAKLAANLIGPHGTSAVGLLTLFYNEHVSITGILAVTTVAHLLGVPSGVLTSLSGFGRAGNVSKILVPGTQPVMMICL
jgi:hypothetical protein